MKGTEKEDLNEKNLFSSLPFNNNNVFLGEQKPDTKVVVLGSGILDVVPRFG